MLDFCIFSMLSLGYIVVQNFRSQKPPIIKISLKVKPQMHTKSNVYIFLDVLISELRFHSPHLTFSVCKVTDDLFKYTCNNQGCESKTVKKKSEMQMCAKRTLRARNTKSNRLVCRCSPVMQYRLILETIYLNKI